MIKKAPNEESEISVNQFLRLLTGIAKRPAIECEALKLCRLKIIVMPREYLLAVMHREMKLNKLV